MSLLQIAYLILTTCIHTQTSSSASLTKTIQPTGEIWLQQIGNDLNPTDATSYGTIDLGQVMSIEFDFDFHGRSNDPPERVGYQENFFRIGYETCCSQGCNGEGSSYPAMFLARSSIGDIFDIKVSDGSTCGATHYLSDYGVLSTTKTHHIKISFNNTKVVVDITGAAPDHPDPYTTSWTRQPTPKDYLGDTVNVYFLSPTFYSTPYNRGWATFNNIIIKSNIFTFAPTFAPTIPTINPTNNPSYIPTNNPSYIPTYNPTSSPSNNPTNNPTQQPSNNPTQQPSNNPTNNPIFSPSNNPTIAPSISPTISPTPAPINNPTMSPTEYPTIAPTIAPSIPPTFKPSEDPTLHPTLKPTIKLIVRDLTDNPTIQIYSTDGVQQTMDEKIDEIEVKSDNYSLMYFIIIISVATFIISLTMLFIIEFYVKKYKKIKQEMENKSVAKNTSIKAQIPPINTNMKQIPTRIKINTISTTVRQSNTTLFPPIHSNVEMIIRSDTCTSGIGSPIDVNAEEMHEMSFVATDDGYGNDDFELTMDKPKLINNPTSDSELLYNDPGRVHKETAHTPIGHEEV